METVLAYITTKDKEEARRIGKHLVERRLAACVNIMSGIESHYWWEGKLESSEECVVIAKTVSSHERELEAAVRNLHSYSTPCILFFKVQSGTKDYIQWVFESCKSQGEEK